MKKGIKRATIAALAGVLTVGMLAGCGEKEKLDGTKAAATVNGTEIPMGILSLYARESQAQTEAMYRSFMGSSAGIWDQVADEESGETYGQQAVKDCLVQIEKMYLMKEKAADYGVEITEEEKTAIADAAKAFMEANDEETIEALAVTEEQVKELLELETYRERIFRPVADEAGIEVSEEDAQQSAFTYVSISTSGEDITEDDAAGKKKQAKLILDKMQETPDADMDEIAKSVDESFAALSGTFFAKDNEDEDYTSASYAEEVLTALRTLKEGEVYGELVETDSSIYIVRLDAEKDEDATLSKMESIKNTKEGKYYNETLEKWLEEAEVKADDKVVETLKITNNHTFTIKVPEAEEAPVNEDTEVFDEEAEIEEEIPVDEDIDDAEVTVEEETEADTETEEVKEEDTEE